MTNWDYQSPEAVIEAACRLQKELDAAELRLANAEALLRRLVAAEAGNADIFDVAYEAKRHLEGEP